MKSKIEQHISGKKVLLILTMWIALSALTGIGTFFALRSAIPHWATTNNQAITISAEVYFLFLVCAYSIFGGLKGIRERLNFRFTATKDIWLAIRWYFIGLTGSLTIYLILRPLIGPLAHTLYTILLRASDMARLPSAGPVAWFLIILRACILAPLTEELLFRGLLFGWLRFRFSAIITIALTSLLFTGMHFYPILYPIGFLFGLISGWIRERTGSSFNFVIAHILNSVLFLSIAYFLIK